MTDPAAPRRALVALLKTHLPDGFPVFEGDPAEDRPTSESIWIEDDRTKRTPEWIGNARPREDIQIDLILVVYRESDGQQSAQALARSRADYLEQVIADDILGPGDLNSTVNWGFISETDRSNHAAPDGWTRRVAMTVEATHYPLCS